MLILKMEGYSWNCLLTTSGPRCRSQRSRSLRYELSSLARTLGSWVQIPLKAWISVCVYSVFVFSCVDNGLATGSSPVQGVLPIVLGLRNWNETKHSTDAVCSKVGASGKRKREKERESEWSVDHEFEKNLFHKIYLHFSVTTVKEFSPTAHKILAYVHKRSVEKVKNRTIKLKIVMLSSISTEYICSIWCGMS
jgi:hypothetical protein